MARADGARAIITTRYEGEREGCRSRQPHVALPQQVYANHPVQSPGRGNIGFDPHHSPLGGGSLWPGVSSSSSIWESSLGKSIGFVW